MLTDIRHALRLLARSPLFTATSVLSVAIGIAAATVIFELADALLWRASPGIREASRVVDIARTTNGRGFGTMSYPAFRYLREQTQSLEAMAATTLSPVPMSLRDSAGASDGRVRRARRACRANAYTGARCRLTSSTCWACGPPWAGSSGVMKTTSRMRGQSSC